MTINWNTTVVGSLVLNTNYDSSGNAVTTSPPTFLIQANGGVGTCTQATNAANGTLDFGSDPSDTGAAYTACDYENAIVAQVVTNSTNWDLEQQTSGAVPANYTLCALPNNATNTFSNAAYPGTVVQFSGTSRNATAFGATAACPTHSQNSTTGGAAQTLSTTNQYLVHGYTTAGTEWIGEDIALITAPLATTGAQTLTLNFTLVAH